MPPIPCVVLAVEDVPLAAFPDVFDDVVEPFLGAGFLAADDDFFLEAPHVDMTSYTVPTGRHTPNR